MEDFKNLNNKNIEDFNSEVEFDSEILARSNIDFNTNKQKFNKNKKMFFNILVIGPCDSGKTTFIEAISKKLDKRFKIKLPDFPSSSPTNPISNGENNNNSAEYKVSNSQITRKRSIRKTSIENFILNVIDYKQTLDFNTYEFVKENIDNNNKHNYDTFKFIDSPGYNYEECFDTYGKRIIDFIIARLDKHFEKSNSIVQNIDEKTDDRIHLVLYFLSNLTNSDLKLMKEISKYSNIIPIIAKGDRYNFDFIESFKEKINKKARDIQLEFYNVYNSLYNLTSDINFINTILSGKTKFCPPFMISDILLSKFYQEYTLEKDSLHKIDMFDINSKRYRDYFYKNECCDFFKLRDILFNFIPFDCVENAKRIYRGYKNEKIQKQSQEKNKVEDPKNYDGFYLAAAMLLTPLIFKYFKEKSK